MKNTTTHPVTLGQLGGLTIPPGEVVEIDDAYCLRQPPHVGHANRTPTASVVELLAPNMLTPATSDDQHKFDTMTTEQLPAYVAAVAALKAQNDAERADDAGRGVFPRMR